MPPAAAPARTGAPAPAPVDALVVAVIALPTAMDAWWSSEGTRDADALTYALLAAQLVALLWRRRWPVAVTVGCGVALSTWYLLGHTGEALNLPAMVGLYTLAAQGDRRRSIVAGVVAAVWSGVVAEVAGDPVGSPMLEMAWPAVPLLLGEVVRSRRELLAEHARREAEAAAEREREARRRAEQERLRIARDLHDVVAHTLAAVNVHMGVAAQALGTHPEAAERAVAQARASSREALSELRAAVAVLRDPDGAEPTTPVPAIDRLDDLVAPARGAGLDVALVVPGEPVPALVGVAAYRIVQEALANVVRHARARAATVTVCVEGLSLVVEVTDDGVGAAATAGGGHGLAGMAERAEALGGRLEAGPAPSGGFRVRATLPLAPSAGAGAPA